MIISSAFTQEEHRYFDFVTIDFGVGREYSKSRLFDNPDWVFKTHPVLTSKINFRSHRFTVGVEVLETLNTPKTAIMRDCIFASAGVNVLPRNWQRWFLSPIYKIGKTTGTENSNDTKAYRTHCEAYGALLFYKFRGLDLFVGFQHIEFKEVKTRPFFPNTLYETKMNVFTLGFSVSLKTFKSENWKN